MESIGLEVVETAFRPQRSAFIERNRRSSSVNENYETTEIPGGLTTISHHLPPPPPPPAFAKPFLQNRQNSVSDDLQTFVQYFFSLLHLNNHLSILQIYT